MRGASQEKSRSERSVLRRGHGRNPLFDRRGGLSNKTGTAKKESRRQKRKGVKKKGQVRVERLKCT